MAKGYYESSGSDYLNDSPSVSKNGQGSVPHHTHDDRYYRKDEVDATQKDYDLQFSELEQDMFQVRSGLESKASIYHTHNLATSTEPGFMSADDKRALDSVSGGTRTNIHITDSQVRVIPATTATKLIFSTKSLDTNNEYDMPSDTFTAKSTGMYLITVMAELESNSTTTGRLFLQTSKNGVLEGNFAFTYIMGGTFGGIDGSTCLYLQEGDQIVVRIWSSYQVSTRGKEHMKITRLW